MITKDKLQELHRRNWEWRAWMSKYTAFATPSNKDAIGWGVTEIGEAIEAGLDAKHIYDRNNPVERDDQAEQRRVHEELGDLAMDLLAALPPYYLMIENQFQDEPDLEIALGEIMIHVANAYRCSRSTRMSPSYAREWSMLALYAIATYPGMDLERELESCWKRIKDKRTS